MTIIDRLVRQPAAWLAAEPGDDGVIVSSRVRLARNLEGEVFPSRASPEALQGVLERTGPVLQRCASLQPVRVLPLDRFDDIERTLLVERRLISREHAAPGPGRALAAHLDERISVMINEEDHVRLQVLLPGWRLREAWRAADRLDSEIEQSLAFAYSPQRGYLTACPSNVGTGMRASVMLHLPGLVLMEEIGAVLRGLGKIGLAVRGLWGEGTEALGHFFQISHQATLGITEDHLVSRMASLVQELAAHERHARARLIESRGRSLRDHVGRAYGVLAYAHTLATAEALGCLSCLRLGVQMGILKRLDKDMLNELLLKIQPGHLQRAAGRRLSRPQRDAFRADMVRARWRRRRSKES